MIAIPFDDEQNLNIYSGDDDHAAEQYFIDGTSEDVSDDIFDMACVIVHSRRIACICENYIILVG